MRVLVVTVVHVPLDARIHHRQIAMLRRAGHEVVYAAPFSGYGTEPGAVTEGVRPIDLPRAVGRRRWRALRAARRVLAREGPGADLVMLHDPELLLALPGLRLGIPVVWDVHEDLGASLTDKRWLPAPLVPLVRAAVRLLEWFAERRVSLLLAESGYAARFRRAHPVVPNVPWLPGSPSAPGDDRVVYLGRVSRLRGGEELLALGARLRAHGIDLEVIGPVDADLAPAFAAASARGELSGRGFVPGPEALARLDGALAGLSLLHDHENYRHSLPTKILEYQAAGIPVITTPIPVAERIVRDSGSGVVVPFRDLDAVETEVLALRDDRDRARELGRAGRRSAEEVCWDRLGVEFVETLEGIAARGQSRP